MVDGYAYDADMWCESCLPVGTNHPEVSYDDGETDSPSHCTVCRVMLKHSLTRAGVTYVIDHLQVDLCSGPKDWNAIWCLPTVPAQFSTPDVLGLLQAIRTEDSHDKLPILADALEEAGYNGQPLLDALRGKVTGGFVVLRRLVQAITSTGIGDNDHYALTRNVEISREWAKMLKNQYGLYRNQKEVVDRFLALTEAGKSQDEIERMVLEYATDDESVNIQTWQELANDWGLGAGGAYA